jgi:hypothetical protein
MRFTMLRRLALAIAPVLAIAGFALAGTAASAAVVTGPAYTNLTPGPALAGYQVNGNGLKAYNEVRGTVHIPAGSTSNMAVYLQVNPLSGGITAELALVKGGNGCAADQWGLEAGIGNNTSPGPLSLVSLTIPVPDHTCVSAGGSEYLEVHYSTLLRRIAFVAGPNEFGDTNTLTEQYVGFQVFRSPAVGVHYTAALPAINTPQASFTRDGLTSLDNPHARRGGTNDRLNLASQSTLEVEALVNNSSSAPTVSNPAFLSTSAFGSGGAFSVTASS